MKTILFFLLPGLLLAATPEQKIKQEVALHLKELNGCYSESGDTRKGTVVMTWSVNDKGEVVMAKATIKSTLRNLGIHLCLASRLKAIKFPPAPKGKVVPVSYTFDFTK